MKLFHRLRSHRLLRYPGYGLAILIALLAGAVVASLTIDLGPRVRELAERQGSAYLERPLHIGRLGIHVASGRVLVEDLRIDGLHPADRPFFTAARIFVTLDWWPLLAKRPDVAISGVEMTDWAMLVEKWEDRHNFPRLTRDDNQPGRPRPFTVTMRDLRASRGRFTFEDHEAPWSVDCPNLDIRIGNLPQYHGTATFAGGTLRIQDNLPMRTNMAARFVIDGSRIRLTRIEVASDGASTVARGEVDLANWPNQHYDVQAHVNFPRMREIFFKTERWRLTGEGDFTGAFSLGKGGQRDLAGTFTSDRFTYDDYRFPGLFGSLRWTPTAFDVWDAGATFSGGTAAFSYSIKPLGSPTRPTARFDTTLSGVDLAPFTDFEALRGMRFAGLATWHNVMEWSLGRLHDTVRGNGHLTVDRGSAVAVADARHRPVAGEITYVFDPNELRLDAGRFETARTRVTFSGTTEWGERSRLPFHVVSDDWQESDQVLTGIMTDFGSPADPVEFYGRGEFDGVMLGAFRHPRVEGTFDGRDLVAWDTVWGSGRGKLVVDNSYVDIADASVKLGDSEIRADGRFSLGYPRDDGGLEIDARFRALRRDLDGLRHAFNIDDYPVSGKLTGDFHLTGEYQRPVGFGAMTIEDGVAYGEPFEKTTAALRFDGAGVQLDNISMTKGAGVISGAALVHWDSTYAFTAKGDRIQIQDLAFAQHPNAPLAGLAAFSADGNGTFEAPQYTVTFTATDVHVAEQHVGQVNGTLTVRDQALAGTIDVVHGADIAEGRLTIHGTGRIAMSPQADAQIALRFDDSSLDPYVRLFEPQLSQYISAVASGSMRITGPLARIDRLGIDATVDSLEVRVVDQVIRNDGPLRLALDGGDLAFQQVQLVGVNTRLGLTGALNLRDQRIGIQASGDADLGLIQGIANNVHGSGRATLRAAVNGTFRRPEFSGTATITDGRIRHQAMPASLDAINGTITFDAGGLRFNDIAATIGDGHVQFGGRIGFDGFVPAEVNVTARGEDIHLRYPEGVRSTVGADLAVTGTVKAPTLSGTITVRSAIISRRVDAPGSIFDLAGRRSAVGAGTSPEAAASVPLKYDIQLIVPSTLRVENNLVRLVANADLNLRGTYDRPILFGHGEVERGEVTFEGQRYRITRGAIDFTNPNRIEPFFDVEAETNVRVPNQTYRITVGAAGTVDQLRPTVSSDPPLPTADVLALLFGDVSRSSKTAQDVPPELRALQNPQQAQTDILTARATQAIAAPISAEVGKVVEQTFGVDTFQLTPSFIDPYSTQTSRLNPTARVTIGKRISDRVYFTFSRSLGTAFNDQILLLEIEQSDRLSMILSRNEDSQTYALELRVRHVF